MNHEQVNQGIDKDYRDLPDGSEEQMTQLSGDPTVQVKQLLRQQKAKDEEMKQLKQNVEMQKKIANEFEEELRRTRIELDEAREMIASTDKKYNKAKKLIQDLQDKETGFLKRIENYTMQIQTLEKTHEIEMTLIKKQLERKLSNGSNVNGNNSALESFSYRDPEAQPKKDTLLPEDPSSMNYDLLTMFDLPKHSSLERTFGSLISKLDDMLDSRTAALKRQETPKMSPVVDSSDNDLLDNTALKYRALLKGPRHARDTVKPQTFSSDDISPEISTTAARRVEHSSNITDNHCTPSNSDTSPSSKQSSNEGTPANFKERTCMNERKTASLVEKRRNQLTGAKPDSILSIISTVSTASETSTDRRLDDTTSVYLSLPTWSCQEVADWLISVDMLRFTQTFLQHKVNGSKLLSLDNEKLKVMGITEKHDKTLLKKRIKELKGKHEREKKNAGKMAKKHKKGLKSGRKLIK